MRSERIRINCVHVCVCACVWVCRFGSVSYVVKYAMIRKNYSPYDVCVHCAMHIFRWFSVSGEMGRVFRLFSAFCRLHTTHTFIESNSSVDDNVMRTKSVHFGLLMKRLFLFLLQCAKDLYTCRFVSVLFGIWKWLCVLNCCLKIHIFLTQQLTTAQHSTK